MDADQDKTGTRWLEQLPLWSNRPGSAVAAMLAIVVVAFVIRLLSDPVLPPGFPYVTFFPAVILSSFLFGARIGAVAGVLCGMLSWYFFIAPHGSLALNAGTVVALGFYLVVVGTDILVIHWMQGANRKLKEERETNRRLADTRELLFRELQHRVSNNLQVAAGLLTLQKRGVADSGARLALDQAAHRLALIGRISRQLYDSSGGMRSLSQMLEPLCADVTEASGRSDLRCVVSVRDDMALASEAAIPLALIVAESVANAIEHGFAEGRAGLIDVEALRLDDGRMCIEIRDNGHGLPAQFDLAASESLGLRIAVMLAKQLGGEFTLRGGERTVARLCLPD